MTKEQLRKVYKTERDNISQDERTEYSRIMIDTLCSLDEYKNAKSILVYSSFGSEVVLDTLVQKAKEDRKNLYYPLCGKCGNMDFYKVDSENQLQEGHYGIKEPIANLEKYENTSKNHLIIVPGLAFDKNGYRLGYGGGYYDRFLPRFDGVSIGLVYSELLVENLPCDIYDKSVDIVLTEKGEADGK